MFVKQEFIKCYLLSTHILIDTTIIFVTSLCLYYVVEIEEDYKIYSYNKDCLEFKLIND